MSARKPLNPSCTGDRWCPVRGQVIERGGGHWRRQLGHIDLTPGQRKTLAERRAASHDLGLSALQLLEAQDLIDPSAPVADICDQITATLKSKDQP